MAPASFSFPFLHHHVVGDLILARSKSVSNIRDSGLARRNERPRWRRISPSAATREESCLSKPEKVQQTAPLQYYSSSKKILSAMFSFLIARQRNSLLRHQTQSCWASFFSTRILNGGNSRLLPAVPSSGILSTPWVSSILCRSKHTLKTNKSIAKRFRVRGDGTLKR